MSVLCIYGRNDIVIKVHVLLLPSYKELLEIKIRRRENGKCVANFMGQKKKKQEEDAAAFYFRRSCLMNIDRSVYVNPKKTKIFFYIVKYNTVIIN